LALKSIGITGQRGFIGYHLSQTILLFKEEFQLLEFDRSFFDDAEQLDRFVSNCDVLVHLAALNRHHDPDEIYNTNLMLVEKLVASFLRTGSRPHVIISSSLQEAKDNVYGRSKKEGREMLSVWAKQNDAIFTGLIIPNVFGPFGKPFFNSVVSTFCHQLTNNERPVVEVDNTLELIYVGDLVAVFIEAIRNGEADHAKKVNHKAVITVSALLEKLSIFKKDYQDDGKIPALPRSFDLQLFNSFRCYMNMPSYFPRKFMQHADSRGSFVELTRADIGGQTSFSTTLPNITRGNHYHTRKIERFAVIKGKALIELRRMGTEEVLAFHLDGDDPSYVDMPIWYTHNIKNTGEELLYTVFWINEPYDPIDPDTYFDVV
jgi:UDP-2-acetamido-2,6-beta-L-arabino-hexul-4-ose reductase